MSHTHDCCRVVACFLQVRCGAALLLFSRTEKGLRSPDDALPCLVALAAVVPASCCLLLVLAFLVAVVAGSSKSCWLLLLLLRCAVVVVTAAWYCGGFLCCRRCLRFLSWCLLCQLLLLLYLWFSDSINVFLSLVAVFFVDSNQKDFFWFRCSLLLSLRFLRTPLLGIPFCCAPLGGYHVGRFCR